MTLVTEKYEERFIVTFDFNFRQYLKDISLYCMTLLFKSSKRCFLKHK